MAIYYELVVHLDLLTALSAQMMVDDLTLRLLSFSSKMLAGLLALRSEIVIVDL